MIQKHDPADIVFKKIRQENDCFATNALTFPF